MKHSYSRLIWLLDLALLYPTLDSEEVWAAAGEFGARRCLVLSWRALADLLDVPLREADRARIPRLGLGERLFLRWLKEGRQPSVMGELLCVLQAPGWSARANYLRELFFPPGQTASVSARLRHLASMARDELRRLLGGGPSR